MRTMKLHLVDGTYELFRAFYGATPQTSQAGHEVGGTRGLLASLLSLLRQSGVTHVAAAFDTVVESFRNQLFPGYKTGEGIDPYLLSQFPLAERAAHALGIVVWPMVELEADDALASAATRWAGDFEQVVICSPDKDLAQCVRGQQVVCLDRRRETTLDEAGVWAKFGVGPASIPDWLALVGDKADGIPGLPGWGAKTAATVLARYGHVEAVPADAEQWEVKVRGGAQLAATLAERRQDALLYRKLATLVTDAPLAESLADLEWRGARRRELTALCEETGSTSLLDRVRRWRDE